METTLARTHPKTGERQTRTVDNPADVVRLKFDGWRLVEDVAPRDVDAVAQAAGDQLVDRIAVDEAPAPADGDQVAVDQLAVADVDEAPPAAPTRRTRATRTTPPSELDGPPPETDRTDSVPVVSPPETGGDQ